MNIHRAILIVITLIIIEVVLTLGVFALLEKYTSIETFIYYSRIITIVITVFSYLIIFRVFRIKTNWKRVSIKFSSLKLNILFYLIIIIIGLEFFDRPFHDFSKILEKSRGSVIEPYEHFKRTNISLLYKSISILIIAPVFEELLFRKYLLIELLKKYPLKWSVILSSVLFSLIHLPNYGNLIPTFVFGIICCLIYLKTKNILYTIILHFLFNFIPNILKNQILLSNIMVKN